MRDSRMRSETMLVIFTALMLTTALLPLSEASLMGRGVLGRSRNRNKVKPWDVGRTNHHNNLWVEEDEGNFNNQYGVEESGEPRRRPCVGICYYKKLLRLQNGEDPDDFDVEDESRQRRRQRPCVGLCYHYKLLGIKNPFEKERNA